MDCSAAIRLDPIQVDALNTRGLAHAQKGNWEKAVRDFNEMIRLDPENPRGYKNRSFAYSVLGDAQLAAADATEAIRRNPTDPTAHYNRGYAHLLSNDFDRAIADMSEAIRLHKEARSQAPPRVNGSKTVFRRNLYWESSDGTFQNDPNFAAAFANRGFAYGSKGDFGRAIADFDEALRLNPDNQEVRALRVNAVKAKASQN